MDLLALLCLMGVFVYRCGQTLPEDTKVSSAYLEGEDYQSLNYVVVTEERDYAFEVAAFFDYAKIPAVIFAVVELSDLFGALFYTTRIRRLLKPLNDLALQAEAISEVTLDTTKFEELEQAILKVPADKNGARIATGDKDLASIEAALNSLLYRMQEARMQQTRFVDDASHELRTPIAVIQGYANMLDRWGKEDEAVLEEAIEAIKNESEAMKELIDQLLFLARGDNGRQKLSMETLNLNEIVKDVWEESAMIDADHNYVCDELPGARIHGDTAMMKQSIRIFVQNAAKYSAKGDTIRLGVKRIGNKYAYIVQDEGIGMTSDEVVHIFERFYRSDAARNSDTGGSGLGLSIAKWIIDAHGGSVEVLSRKDFGTRFTVSFDAV